MFATRYSAASRAARCYVAGRVLSRAFHRAVSCPLHPPFSGFISGGGGSAGGTIYPPYRGVHTDQSTAYVSRIQQTIDDKRRLCAVSSIQPLGGLHVGHYFGCIKQCVEEQKSSHDVIVCIADTEALVRLLDTTTLRDNILGTAATLIACGLDPDRTIIYQQSRVSEHAQLDWILHCTIDQEEPWRQDTHSSRLSLIKDPTLGEYVAPVARCATLLLHRAALAPAGTTFRDQHKMASRAALRFNKKFGDILLVPQLKVDDFCSNIRSLRRPTESMSRLEPDSKSRLELLDSPETIRENCKKAVTDFTSEVYFDAVSRPGVSNMMVLHSLVTGGKDCATLKQEAAGLETAQYKLVVADALNEYLEPIKEKTAQLLRDKTSLLCCLESGATKAKLRAEETMQLVHQAIGFHPQLQHLKQSQRKTSHLNFRSLSSSTASDPPEKSCVVPSSSKDRKVIFSGIQPTGVLHLGNYFGAVKQWVDLQCAGDDVTICIVDQHAITVPQSHESLHDNILAMAASIIACGVNPEVSCLFQQSSVPQHAELNTVLRCVTQMALLSGQAHYKDKMKTLQEAETSSSPSLGLFTYPVLQAADILLYRTTHVPVGDDQKQHIQVAKEIAKRFNKRYGPVFWIPKPIILDDCLARLKSLCLPAKKMSKSETNANGRIEILDSPESILSKCLGATVECSPTTLLKDALHFNTSTGGITSTTRVVGLDNLLAMHSMVSGGVGGGVPDLAHGSTDIEAYKRLVADSVVEHLRPIRTRALQLLEDRQALVAVLARGGAVATEKAASTMQSVHQAVGFR